MVHFPKCFTLTAFLLVQLLYSIEHVFLYVLPSLPHTGLFTGSHLVGHDEVHSVLEAWNERNGIYDNILKKDWQKKNKLTFAIFVSSRKNDKRQIIRQKHFFKSFNTNAYVEDRVLTSYLTVLKFDDVYKWRMYWWLFIFLIFCK